MANNYQRLSLSEREEISRMLALGHSLRSVSRKLDRQPSSISREVRLGNCNRNTYRAVTAEHRARRRASRRKCGKRKLFLFGRLRHYVFRKIRLNWSPEQIAEALKRDYPDDISMRISSESIYTYIYVLPRGSLKQELLDCLRHPRKYRHHRRALGKPPIERKLEDMLSIEERPKEVESRIVPGHWEGDLIIGRNRQSALGTLVERTTRTTILVPVKSRQAFEVAHAFARAVKRLPKEMKLSLTYDQGREMAAHKLFTKLSGVKVYFAHPRSPWERGTNENTNGLIRQYFPKGTDFTKVSRKEVKRAQDRLNGRPRKALGFMTPYEMFKELMEKN